MSGSQFLGESAGLASDGGCREIVYSNCAFKLWANAVFEGLWLLHGVAQGNKNWSET